MRTLLPLAALCGCLDHSLAPGADEGEFIAMQADFADFEGWESFKVGDGSLGESHLSGERWAFISAMPPDGSETFPVGTIIVKTAETSDDRTEWPVVARVKRGGGYNPDGAVGWEWFDLNLSAAGTPVVEWRGPEAPDQSSYECSLGSEDSGALSLGDCNGCHQAAWANDYVMSAALALKEW